MWRTPKRPLGVACFFVPTATSYLRTSCGPTRTTRILFWVLAAMVSGPETTAFFVARSVVNSRATRSMSDLWCRSGAECLHRVGFRLVHAEHREEVRQAEGTRHAVLRFEQAEGGAVAFGGLQALHQLAETVAVDVVHLREVEEDLLAPVLQDGIDDAGQYLIADADRQPAFEVDDGYVFDLAHLDVHGAQSYRRRRAPDAISATARPRSLRPAPSPAGG